ncbi:hypothetical protein ACFQLX_04085 [Streptomyces polyrhachis]|uniref:Uncharacterized protein n=1 Tax=Streptomyces polyrhachis TaxID=1282885 RepID=A0ABW2GBG4_9ACTN
MALFAAAIDSGCYTDATRRILAIGNTAETPETSARIEDMPGFAELSARFDRIVSFDAAVAPLHPAEWRVRAFDAPVWERQWRAWWELGTQPVGLVLDGLGAGQSAALAEVFADAQLEVCAGGAEVYGPTPESLPRQVALRVRRLLHLELLAGTAPRALSELGVPALALPAEAVRAVVRTAEPAPGPTRYARESVLLVAPTEPELCQLLLHARESGYGPAVAVSCAPGGRLRALERTAREQSAPLTVIEPAQLTESLYETLGPAALATADASLLLRARALYGVTPLPHPAAPHTPQTALAAASFAAAPDLAALADALAYTHRPRAYAALRAQAAAYLRTAPRTPYIPRRRLIALGLPGGAPAPLRPLLRTDLLPRAARWTLRSHTLRRTAKRLLARSGAARRVAGRVKGL